MRLLVTPPWITRATAETKIHLSEQGPKQSVSFEATRRMD